MIQTDQTYSGTTDPFLGDKAEERVAIDFEGLGRTRPIESNWHRAWRRFKANRLSFLALIINDRHLSVCDRGSVGLVFHGIQLLRESPWRQAGGAGTGWLHSWRGWKWPRHSDAARVWRARQLAGRRPGNRVVAGPGGNDWLIGRVFRRMGRHPAHALRGRPALHPHVGTPDSGFVVLSSDPRGSWRSLSPW